MAKHMTLLSVNVNKIALLRNSRGRDYPGVIDFAATVLRLGVKGITVHPRPDERHVTRKDVYSLRDFLRLHPDIEFNIEGYPSQAFMDLVLEIQPTQCTLVPDDPAQLTSDHGWDVVANEDMLKSVLSQLREAGIRSSLFLDPEPERIGEVKAVGADRIELYTEEYASNYGLETEDEVWQRYAETAAAAAQQGIGVNAGHDLDLNNLPRFLQIPGIQEVSIGHALVVECLYQGVDVVIGKYLEITKG